MTATVAESSSSSTTTTRPVRAYGARTPKWQRFQVHKIQPGGNENNNSNKTGNVRSDEKEVYAYQRQYSHVYSHRLLSLKDRCWKALTVNKNTNNDDDKYSTVNRILELQENQPSHVVGTLVKETNDPKEQPLMENCDCRPSDQLFLEDESGRVVLSLTSGDDHHVYQYCTGMVVGVQGKVDDKGVLHVEKIVPPAPVAPPSTSSLTLKQQKTATSAVVTESSQPYNYEPHLLLVSSLHCGDPYVSSLPREILVGYLQGQFTKSAAKVARIIVAGSGPSPSAPLQGLQEFDMWAGLQVSNADGLNIPMDIVPSAVDPTTRNWPQRPLHTSLLPHCSNHNKKTIMLTPNPYESIHGARYVLGTDGLNVRDLQQTILKPTADDDDGNDDANMGKGVHRLTELEALEQTLKYAHICPTAPARLGMVPVDDPMVIDKNTPHIYFCGNCEEGFATKLIGEGEEKTRLVCIPKFSQTGEAVLVNLNNLDVEVLRFKVDEEGDQPSET
jgi:DNA polymerase delta subunit 2